MAAGQSLDDTQREILAGKQPLGENAALRQIGLSGDFLCSDGAVQITARRSKSMAAGWRARAGAGSASHPAQEPNGEVSDSFFSDCFHPVLSFFLTICCCRGPLADSAAEAASAV